ncbi:MAG: redox-active disulfide protein 2 [Spirosomataceae bacterium]|jgi:thiamine transporter ThiT
MKIQFKKDNFSDLTTEELIKRKKTTTMVTGFLAGLLTVLLIMAILLAIEQGLIGYSLIAVALSLSSILFINYSSIKTINEELKSRNLS